MIKKNRERGSPCLKPLDALIHPLAFSFTKIEKLVEDKQPLIQDLYLVPNPFLSSTWSRKPQSTLSYAFLNLFKDHSTCSWSRFLIHQFISNQNYIQNFQALNKKDS